MKRRLTSSIPVAFEDIGFFLWATASGRPRLADRVIPAAFGGDPVAFVEVPIEQLQKQNR